MRRKWSKKSRQKNNSKLRMIHQNNKKWKFKQFLLSQKLKFKKKKKRLIYKKSKRKFKTQNRRERHKDKLKRLKLNKNLQKNSQMKLLKRSKNKNPKRLNPWKNKNKKNLAQEFKKEWLEKKL